MKECPLCHTRYDDAQNFCFKDGSKLVDVAPQPVEPQTVAPAQARERTIKPSVEELKFPKEGGTKTVEIESDGIGYTFEPIREAKISVDELHNLTITVGPFDGITAAWGTSIVLREDNVECSISISQADWY